MQISWLAFMVQEVSIDPSLVDPVKLPLVAVEIRLAKRPGLRQIHLLELVANVS